MVVREEVSRGTARVRPDSLQASVRSSPRSRRLRMSSTTTMALSTSIPRATIDEMIETRSSSMPNWRITTRPSNRVIGTKDPTMSPLRTPRNSMTTTSTMASV